MAELAGVKVIVSGRVQGVLFRDFTRQHAAGLRLTGHVRNLGQGVEIEAEGERPQLEALISQVKRGPPRAAVEKIELTWGEYSGKYIGFEIIY